MIKDELQFLKNNKLLLMVLAVILLIPSIYAGIFLSSMWDPYGEISKLPVAVVNEDISVDYNGKTLSIGEDLVKSLKTNDAMDFHITDSESANKGLNNGDYYMVITIPADFSKCASSMMDDNPQKMRLGYATNPGYNYISSKLGESAVKEIKANIMAEVTRTYTEAVFASLKDIGDGFSNAANGTSQLLDGMNALYEGTASIADNLNVLADSSISLQEGSVRLDDGIGAYIEGVSAVDDGIGSITDGVSKLSDGAKQLQSGGLTLQYGLNTMKSQIDSSLTSENVSQIQTAASSLITMNDSIQQLNTAVTNINIPVTADMTAADSAQLVQLVQMLAGLKNSVNQIAAASNQLLPASSVAMDSMLTGMQGVKTALGQTMAVDGETGIIEGISQLNTGIAALNSGITGTDGLLDGVDRLKTGTTQLINNGAELKSGSVLMTDGLSRLSDGASSLALGAGRQQDVMITLIDGTSTLNTALNDGANTAADSSVTESNIDMFVTPLTTEETQITSVKNNGHAMAAYMMSVGLWVGSLAFCLMYPLVDYHGMLKNGFTWYASKAVVIYPMAAVMGIALCGILHVTNGFVPVRPGNTMLVSAVASICFMTIMYFFNALLGKVGSFIMLVFMVLQLAGSAGTYPIEISGSFATTIHNYVPFTYTVNAFRSTISGGSSIGNEITVLLVLTAIFMMLTIALFWYRADRINAGKPILYNWIVKAKL